MAALRDLPLLVFVLSFAVLWLSAQIGAAMRRRSRHSHSEKLPSDFTLVLSASLTLLGLIVGFSFSMAVNRYDQRKLYEEEEANAIGTEYLRAGLLPAGNATTSRQLLTDYLHQRILFYETMDRDRLRQIDDQTTRLQGELWSAVQNVAAAQPTAISSLTAAGMNDVINSQGYSQAAWWNRIPHEAWLLMWLIAVVCNVMLGYAVLDESGRGRLLLIMPLLLAIAFFLIADIDSPRAGVIHVKAKNLVSLSKQLALAGGQPGR